MTLLIKIVKYKFMNSNYENDHNKIYLENKEELIGEENKTIKENILLPIQVEKYLNVIYNLILI